jgi:hypothetical protein
MSISENYNPFINTNEQKQTSPNTFFSEIIQPFFAQHQYLQTRSLRRSFIDI